jgi:hypothetical protein
MTVVIVVIGYCDYCVTIVICVCGCCWPAVISPAIGQ